MHAHYTSYVVQCSLLLPASLAKPGLTNPVFWTCCPSGDLLILCRLCFRNFRSRSERIARQRVCKFMQAALLSQRVCHVLSSAPSSLGVPGVPGPSAATAATSLIALFFVAVLFFFLVCCLQPLQERRRLQHDTWTIVLASLCGCHLSGGQVLCAMSCHDRAAACLS